ncbi:uridine phosphorylase 1-like [Dreissena polymorpha]|uniref:Nucleoside phosphorylase domain-containing protein n=1 Tax=Dreissena polymorpha TaxID=45954 RepID=A0A9D4BL88_DREPO|nr:uridine phosphorylase 1-like [Dreissena polymorpha]KAH3700129.1 hypothetical protein DPMN_075097 [Dreissena polymorpha]
MDILEDNRAYETAVEKKCISSCRVPLHNQNLLSIPNDHLYHIALSSGDNDLRQMFGDVKFVCFGGTPSRMEKFARFMSRELGLGTAPAHNFAGNTDRYALYKAGPVLSVSHGIGIPSLSIVFQEIVKLVYYAGCEDVTFFRIGTSGGIGLEPGTVVISESVVNGQLEPIYKQIILGKQVERPAVVDQDLAQNLHNLALEDDRYKTVKGTTLCADDFYEGQGRIDGAFCEHDEEEKMLWLREMHEAGVTNLEMESLGFIAMCHRANIKGAVLCVTLLDRFEGDGITTNLQLLHEWQTYPQMLAARFIKSTLGL